MALKIPALKTGRPLNSPSLPFRLAGSACIALICSTGLLWYSIDQWIMARSNVQFQQSRLKQAAARDQSSLQQVEMAQFAKSFVDAAREKRLLGEQWVGRGVDVREPKAKRRAAVDILSQAQSFRGQVFNAEEFDIAATDASAGLFGDVTQDFQVILKGRSMFRVAK